MTIEFKIGNILDTTETLILHQVNFQGIMNGGLAKQIRNKWPEVYKGYLDFIKNHDWEDVRKNGYYDSYQIIKDKQWIINIFGQEYYGTDKCYTDYVALRNTFENITETLFGFEDNYTIALPDHLGCGLAGGNWEGKVLPIIVDIFNDSKIKVVIYKLEGV